MAVNDPEVTGGMNVNEYQFGGTHYKSKYEHWDFVINTRIGYLEGNATKYLARWRKTGVKGEADLRKALHYVNKLIENAGLGYPVQRMPQRWLRCELVKFCKINEISGVELEAMVAITTWELISDLRVAADSIIIMLEKLLPVPLEDSNKHAERSVPGFPDENRT